MLQETIISNLSKLPDYYLQEVLDFSDYLLTKTVNIKESNFSSRGGFGARKGDYIISEDFDEPLEDFKEYM